MVRLPRCSRTQSDVHLQPSIVLDALSPIAEVPVASEAAEVKHMVVVPHHTGILAPVFVELYEKVPFLLLPRCVHPVVHPRA